MRFGLASLCHKIYKYIYNFFFSGIGLLFLFCSIKKGTNEQKKILKIAIITTINEASADLTGKSI